MTELQMKQIYEWAKPELKGTGWRIMEGLVGRLRAEVPDWPIGDYGLPTLVSLPPLDMNFWHEVCVPRLRDEGVGVSFDSTHWSLLWVAWEWRDNTDPYDILLQYLEAK